MDDTIINVDINSIKKALNPDFTLKVQKLSDFGMLPTKNDLDDAGYDLYCIEEVLLKPMERRAFQLDIAIEIPKGFYGRVSDRSGWSYKHGVHVLGGIVDAGYRGNVAVVLVNLGERDVYFQKGNKIAQIIFERYYNFDIKEVEELSSSQRGANKHGSSGM